jgi:hypothetical protein
MGFQVRYNGSEKAQLAATLSRWQQAGRLVIHCPELAAGLPTPRLPAEILGGRAAMSCRTGADRGKRRPRRHRTLSAGRLAGAKSRRRRKAVRQRYSPTAAQPAAVSLSMTVPLTDSANPVPALPPPAARPRHHGIFRQQMPQLLAWMEQRESDDDSM